MITVFKSFKIMYYILKEDIVSFKWTRIPLLLAAILALSVLVPQPLGMAVLVLTIVVASQSRHIDMIQISADNFLRFLKLIKYQFNDLVANQRMMWKIKDPVNKKRISDQADGFIAEAKARIVKAREEGEDEYTIY